MKGGWEMKKIIMMIMICLTIYFGQGMLNMEASTVAMQEQLVVVHGGDTLWNIAARWTDDNEDVREVLYRIQQKNKLSGKAFLQPGQRLIVPIKASNEMLALR